MDQKKAIDGKQLQELIAKANVCGLQKHPNLPETSRLIIAKADQDKRQLTDAEVNDLCSTSGMSTTVVWFVIENAQSYVDQSKQALLKAHPSLFEPGGTLHPAERAQACWRDCWNFLRVATYATATNTNDCTDPQGIEAVCALYKQLRVPLDGMTMALTTLSSLITSDIQNRNSDLKREALAFKAAFDHLNAMLHKD
jgi:hypothetical protein